MGCPGVLYPPGPFVTVRMRLLLALVLFAPVASAQTADSLQAAAPLPPGERAALVLGGAAAGAVAVTVTHLMVRAVVGPDGERTTGLSLHVAL